MLSPHTTEVEVRDLHRRLLALGTAFLTVAVLLDVLRGGSVAVGAAAHAGYILMVALGGGTLVHRWWYFQPTQMFRRELGGPTGWLDRHDLAAAAGDRGVRAVAPTPPGGPHAPVAEFGWQVGHLVSGPRHLRRVWEPRSWSPASWWPARRMVYSPWSRGFGILGPQGSGKTQFLVHVVLDSPGAAVVSSTKPELVTLTRELRGRVGGTAVFNPALLGSIGSDFAWDPISGCTDQGVAGRRAWALVRGAGGAEGTERASFWARKAQEIVRCYLVAAALAGRDMLDVMRWANNPDDKEPVRILEHYAARVPAGWLETFQTHLAATLNTRTGYFATVTSCVGFMDSPAVAAACRPRPGSSFEVEEFLRHRGTLYLVGGSGDEGLAPLMTALTEYVFDEAQRIAATRPGERLSPTLNFVLDEVAHTTPVPLDEWAADSRGWGITVGAVVQSLSQFASTWGRERGKTIWDNFPTKVILPGVTDTEDLKALSYLAGERWVQRITRGESESEPNRSSHSTSRTPTREPVVSGHTISSMPRWHAYVHGLGRHAAIVGFEPGYRRVARERRRPAQP